MLHTIKLPKNEPCIEVSFFGQATFVQIKSIHSGDFIWCDPWITSNYSIKKQPLEINKIQEHLEIHNCFEKLKGIIISHTHGDHFADVPEIFRYFHDQERALKILGDRNCLSLICTFMASYSQRKYKFEQYHAFKKASFLGREIPLEGNFMNRDRRQKLGLIRNFEPYFETGSNFLLNFPNDSSKNLQDRPNFRVLAYPILFKHTPINETILGTRINLSDMPDKRREYIESGDGHCPSNFLYGFLFVIYSAQPGEEFQRFTSAFAFFPGEFPLNQDESENTNFFNFYKSILNKLDFYYHTDKAKGFADDLNGKIVQNLLRPKADSHLYHIWDGEPYDDGKNLS